jgi:hypothetical protein
MFALVDDINMIDAVVYERAWREETRLYVSGYSSSGYTSDLSDQAFERLGINFVLVVNDRGRILDSRGYDLGEGASVGVPDSLKAHIGPGLLVARNISERKEAGKLKLEAFRQIEKNMEQFAILNDHLRNPLQVIVGLTLLHGENEEISQNILPQAEVINHIVHQLDQGWIESEKIRDWLKRYYEFD